MLAHERLPSAVRVENVAEKKRICLIVPKEDMNSYSFLPLRDFRVLRVELTFHLVFSKTLPVNFFLRARSLR